MRYRFPDPKIIIPTSQSSRRSKYNKAANTLTSRGRCAGQTDTGTGLTWIEEDDGLQSGVLCLIDPHLPERPDNLVHQPAPDLVHRHV